MKRKNKIVSILTASLFILTIVPLMMPNVGAAGVAYNEGDVFCGVGNGLIKHYDPDGNLLDTLDTTSGSSETTGMAFDANDNLYCTLFTVGTMAKFDNMGNLITYPWGGPFSTHPESVVVDANGDLYTGEVDGASDVRKFDQAGTQLDTYDPLTEDRGLDWIDLAADQTTLFYTSEGYDIMRYDLNTKTQLPNFATLPERPAFALRIRQNDEVLVATSSTVYRLDGTGAIMQSYAKADYGESSLLFALNLDPDGTSFWTAGYTSGNVYRIDIETGNLIKTFNAGIEGSSLAGLAIFGEPTAGQPDIEIIKDFRYTSVDFTPYHWEDPDGIPDTGDEYMVQDPAILGDLLPMDVDDNYLVDVVVHEKTGKVKSTNPGQLYGVITITGSITNVFIDDNFDQEFDINPNKLGGGIEILIVDPDGYAEVITDYPGITASVWNDDPWNDALISIDLDVAIGGSLPAGHTLMVYVKFKTAMKHQVFPGGPFDFDFWNMPIVLIDDMDPIEVGANIKLSIK
jgi:hypothetical protein